MKIDLLACFRGFKRPHAARNKTAQPRPSAPRDEKLGYAVDYDRLVHSEIRRRNGNLHETLHALFQNKRGVRLDAETDPWSSDE